MSALRTGTKWLHRYLQETTVHGLRYLSEGRNVFERLFWFCIISAGFTLSTYMIWKSLAEAYDNPILTTIDTMHIKVKTVVLVDCM